MNYQPTLLAACLVLLASCSPNVSRTQAVRTAWQYSQVEWMPQPSNVLHGDDGNGIRVDTPDHSLGNGGWWKPGSPAKGMPYQWGGFDTPDSFRFKILSGYKAGDIGGPAKRKLGNDGTSRRACGIDCSGLVSRCWGLSRSYSTREISAICDPLSSWSDLLPGDILLNRGHVILFKDHADGGKSILGYEAGPRPVWRVNACRIDVARLKREGYKPLRYRGIQDF